MIEFLIGTVIAIGIVIYLVVSNKSKNEKDIDSTVLPLPPKPPRDTP